LQAAGLATALTAGEGSGISSRSFFSVRVELTQEGNARVGEVAEVVFKYLELLRAPGGVNEQVKDRAGGLLTSGPFYRGWVWGVRQVLEAASSVLLVFVSFVMTVCMRRLGCAWFTAEHVLHV
jgi:hypothetical protein